MIIRLTVGDNDFSEKIKGYFRDFWMRMLELHPDNCLSDRASYEELRGWRQRENQIRTTMNPNNDHELSDEEKNILIEQIKRTFGQYVNRWCYEDSDYLKNNLTVEILESFTDKWENGEVFYWFQHSNTAICQ